MNYRGQQDASSGSSEFNANEFLIQQICARINTSTLVKVVAVTNDGGVSPVGYVDVQPLVNQIDGNGNATPHGVIHGVPYFRMQGGANAIILDPQIGDIGMAAFASRDISSVIATKAQANPGSWRRYSMADAMYFGGFLNGTPTQYVAFSGDGIKIHSPTKVTLEAPNVDIETQTLTVNASAEVNITTPTFKVNGAAQFSSTVQATGAVTMGSTLAVNGNATISGKSFLGHTHNVANVQTGSDTKTSTAVN